MSRKPFILQCRNGACISRDEDPYKAVSITAERLDTAYLPKGSKIKKPILARMPCVTSFL